MRVQSDGTSAGGRAYVVIVHPRPGELSRLGVVASRKAGNAVERNRGKRVVREWFRTRLARHEGYDIVVILRRGAPKLPYATACRELDAGLRRALRNARKD